MDLVNRKSAFEQKKHEWENKLLNSKQNFEKPTESIFSPSKYTQEELESQLKELKQELGDANDSKLIMRISQIENQLIRYRTEKAISECNKKNSRVVYSVVKTFDKETSQDENKRKLLLDKTNKRYLTENSGKLIGENSGDFRLNVKNEEWAKQILSKKHELLLQKEKEIHDKEKYLQETWRKVPGASELIDVIQASLSHLNQTKLENEITFNRVEQDRINLRKNYEKIISILEKLDITGNIDSNEVIEKIKEQLNASLNLL